MEGSAIVQDAEQENIPYLILRLISDKVDESVSDNFNDFIKKYKNFSWNLLEVIFEDLVKYTK